MKVVSMRGNHVDMALLMAQNGDKIALGNANMNARGDIIGQGGVVVKPREQVARDYHRTNPKAVKQVALRNIKDEILTTPAEAWKSAKREVQKETKPQRKIIDKE